MVWPFDKKPVAPERIPTDEIIPLFDRDDTTPNRGISLEYSMIFYEVLDADKLSNALWKLLEKPGWKKLGGRLRVNDKGKLDYHVPAQYTKERPPFNYTHVIDAMPFSEHRIGSKLPALTGKLQVLDRLGRTRVLTDEESTKQNLEDWTQHDVGQLGYDSDPLAKLGTSPTADKDVVMKPYQVSTLGMLRFAFNNVLYEKYFYPNDGARMLILPAAEFSKIKAQAFADLESLDPEKITYTNSAPRKPFLSDGDITTAWLLGIYARSNPEIVNSYPQRIFSVGNVMGMRNIARSSEPKLLPLGKDGAYVHNCVAGSWSILTVGDMLTLPLGHIAARVRSDLVVQSSRPHLEAAQREAKGGNLKLYGSGDMVFSTITNWAKAKLFEVDFGAARKDGDEGKAVPKFIYPVAQSTSLPLRGSGNCVGRDKDGNWHFGMMMRKEFVEGFVREIEKMGGERT